MRFCISSTPLCKAKLAAAGLDVADADLLALDDGRDLLAVDVEGAVEVAFHAHSSVGPGGLDFGFAGRGIIYGGLAGPEIEILEQAAG